MKENRWFHAKLNDNRQTWVHGQVTVEGIQNREVVLLASTEVAVVWEVEEMGIDWLEEHLELKDDCEEETQSSIQGSY